MENYNLSHPEKFIEIDLHDIYSKILKHRRIILNSIYICVGIAFLYSFIARPVYRSTARIMVEGKAPRITKIDDVVRLPIMLTVRVFITHRLKF